MAVFVSLLVISNIGAVKLISVGPLILDGGAFLFPLVYITGDILSEVYGFKAARKAIFVGFAMAILAAVTFWLVQLSPPGVAGQIKKHMKQFLVLSLELCLLASADFW